MPLAFDSISHGTVAFGFFNIESHMLLLEELFFFADDFCDAVSRLAAGQTEATVPGWRVADPPARGNLHGAIAGADLSGFIGATYRARPFPARPEQFKQNPRGTLARDAVEQMIAPFGQGQQVRLAHLEGHFLVGPYRFDDPGFSALIAYVDQGGYPRWLNEQRPPYVTRMLQAWRQAGGG